MGLDNVFGCLEERGFIDQVTDKEAVKDNLSRPVTCYIGFDPTAAARPSPYRPGRGWDRSRGRAQWEDGNA